MEFSCSCHFQENSPEGISSSCAVPISVGPVFNYSVYLSSIYGASIVCGIYQTIKNHSMQREHIRSRRIRVTHVEQRLREIVNINNNCHINSYLFSDVTWLTWSSALHNCKPNDTIIWLYGACLLYIHIHEPWLWVDPFHDPRNPRIWPHELLGDWSRGEGLSHTWKKVFHDRGNWWLWMVNMASMLMI